MRCDGEDNAGRRFAQFLQSPNVIGQTRFHRGCDSQRLMNAAEVVMGKVQLDRVALLLQLLATSVCQPRKALHRHARGAVSFSDSVQDPEIP